MRAVVCNAFADDNRGGAAITTATIEAIQSVDPGASVTLVAVDSRADRLPHQFRFTLAATHDVDAVPAPVAVPPGALGGARAVARSLVLLIAPGTGRDIPAVVAIRSADVVVSKGGHVFVDRRGFGGLLSLWLTTLPLLLARRFHVPAIALATTVGPFEKRSSSLLCRLILRRLRTVAVRDSLSFTAASEIGLRPPVLAQVPDIVFGTPPPDEAASAARAASFGLAGTRFAVLVGRMDSLGDAPDIDHLADVGQRLIDRGIVDSVVVATQVLGAEDSDATATARLRARLDHRATVIEDLSPSGLIELYGAAELVVSYRLHALIFSIVAGTPGFSLARSSTKLQGVLEAVGLGDHVLGSPAVDVETHVDHIAKMVADRPAARARIASARAAAHADAGRIPDLIRALL